MRTSSMLANWLFLPSLFLFCSTLKASPLIDLRLQAPATCPSRDAIESTLARLVTEPPAVPLHVTARFMQENGRWVLFATLENGQRVIAGDTCVAVAEALVVIMALAIDPNAKLGAETFQDFERANAARSPAATGVVETATGRASAARSDGTWRVYDDAPEPHGWVPQRHHGKEERWGASLLMLSEVGMLPEWSLGPSLVTRYGSFGVWGEVALSTLWPRFAASTADPNKGGRIGWFAAQVSGCAGLGAGLPIAACAGFESGDLYGYGVNTGYKNVGYGFWPAFTAGAVYRGNLRRDWALELRLGSAIPLARPVFGLEGYGEVFQPSAVSFRAAIGLAWR